MRIFAKFTASNATKPLGQHNHRCYHAAMHLMTWKQGLRQTFSDTYGWPVFITSSIGLFLLLLMIPVWTTPGHDLLFQLELLGVWGTLLVATLSLGNGLLFAMQTVIHRKRRKSSAAKNVAKATTLTGILTTSLGATLACAACYSSILSIFGLGATAFVVEYRAYIAILALGLTTAALYYSAKRLNNACAVCHV